MLQKPNVLNKRIRARQNISSPVFERLILPLICNFCSPRKWLGEKSLKVVNVEMIYQTKAETRIWKVAITKPEVDYRCENYRYKQSEDWYKYGRMEHSWMSRQTPTSRTNTSQNNCNGFKRVIQESESALHLSWNIVTWQLSGKQSNVQQHLHICLYTAAVLCVADHQDHFRKSFYLFHLFHLLPVCHVYCPSHVFCCPCKKNQLPFGDK